MAKRQYSYLYMIVLALIGALAYCLWASPEAVDQQQTDVSALVLDEVIEIPQMDESCSEQIIQHLGYVVSYNPELRIPNWVAYELTAEEVKGTVERSEHFYPDPLVKGSPVVTSDYSNSGYDRGHMAPAADMRWSEQAMEESFYMTNMCPQNHNLNKGDWNDLEMKVRNWTKYYDHVYVCCGPIVEPGYETIGKERKIAVPSAFYKVILVEKKGTYKAIGFVMNNEAGHQQLSAYAMPVDDVEKRTGLDFFHAVPDDIEAQAESACDLAYFHVK